jgi:putative tRNA adenosine deaminase-associated protein
MSHFACVMLGDRGSWRLLERSLDGCESVDDVADMLRDYNEPVRLVAVEQADEYAVLLRFDPTDDECDVPPRVFLSNGHAPEEFPLAAMFADGLEEVGGDPLSGEEVLDMSELENHDAAPFGDSQLVEDLGMKAPELVELAIHPSTLPIDLIESLCQRLGCLEEFDTMRG